VIPLKRLQPGTAERILADQMIQHYLKNKGDDQIKRFDEALALTRRDFELSVTLEAWGVARAAVRLQYGIPQPR
jgi:hypothetical protein